MRLLKIGCQSRHLVVTVLLLIFVDPLVALNGKSPAVADKTIGVLYWSMEIPGQIVMRQGTRCKLKRLTARFGHGVKPESR
jgi:hypothetical protein